MSLANEVIDEALDVILPLAAKNFHQVRQRIRNFLLGAAERSKFLFSKRQNCIVKYVSQNREALVVASSRVNGTVNMSNDCKVGVTS